MSSYKIDTLNNILYLLNRLMNNIEDQDQKQWIAEAISNLQTVRNKLNER